MGIAMVERRHQRSVGHQVGQLGPLVVAWTFGLALLAVAGLQQRASLEELFLDPASLAGRPWYTGLLSNIGVLGWSVAAVAAGGGAWVARRAGRPTAVTFLASAALITTLLLFDDLFQVHAVILPSTGMDPTAAQIMVISPAPLWVWLHRAEIARSRWLLLSASIAGFVVSVAADQFVSTTTPASLLLEDGAKLLAIIAWAQYFVLTTRDITASVISEALGYTDRAWSFERRVRVG